MTDLAAIVARDAAWQLRCQFPVRDRLCDDRQNQHEPIKHYIGPQWNHAFQYDAQLDGTPEAACHALLALLRETREALRACNLAPDRAITSQPAITGLRDLYARLAALTEPTP